MSNFKTIILLNVFVTGNICISTFPLIGQGTNQRFSSIVDRYFDESSQLSPVGATGMGDHRFDNEINDVSAEGRKRVATFYNEILAELSTFKDSDLSRDEQIDRALLQHRLKAALWKQNQL